MAIQDTNSLLSANTTYIYDNTTEDVTGTILHDLLRDVIQSSLNRVSDAYVFGNVLIVDPLAVGTGERGNFFKRYQLLGDAEADSMPGDTIWFLPGTHATAGNNGRDQLTYKFFEGAELSCTTTMFTGTGISYNIYGKGRLHCTSGYNFHTQGCTITCEARILINTGGSNAIVYAEGGRVSITCEEFSGQYDAFILDASSGYAYGDEDYLNVTAGRGFANHTAGQTINTGGGASTGNVLMYMKVGEHIVGWTGLGGGWAGYNVGGEIIWEGLLRRQTSVSDDSGAWFYAHGIAVADSTIRFRGRTLLLSDDGANWSEMRYGFRCDSNNSFNFYLEAGSYLHSHSYVDSTSTPIFWSNDVPGLLDLRGTLDQNGDSGSSGNCIRFMSATVWPTIEFTGCELKQSGGYSADTVYLNAGSTTYIGKLLYRTGGFPVTFTNSITGLEVDF